MGDMRRIAMVLGLLVACDDEPTECAEGGADGTSGLASTTGEAGSSSGESTTGEPAGPTCGELLACYQANCSAVMQVWSQCTAPSGVGVNPSNISLCTTADGADAGISIACRNAAVAAPAEELGAHVTACVYLTLRECMDACGGHDMMAFEAFRANPGAPPWWSSNFTGPYVIDVNLLCSIQQCAADSDCPDGQLCSLNEQFGVEACAVP